MSNGASFQCPDCSRFLYPKSNQSTILSCTCGSVVNINTENRVSSKPYYKIQDVDDPIQPGTEGIWDKKKFVVLGRFRTWIEEFVFNYWTIQFEDGKLRYLGEGYGLYVMYEQAEIADSYTLKDLNSWKTGTHKKLFSQQTYVVERKYLCYKWEIEGEVLLPQCMSSFLICELANDSGKRIELIEFTKNSITAFDVTYTSFSELSLSNLRSSLNSPKTISCIQCSVANEIKGFPYTQSYACLNCGTRYSLQEGSNFKKQTKRNSSDLGTSISLGAKGFIGKVEYEVIGFALKEEKNKYRSQWKEYTLYNQQQGFAFLSEYNGHWTYIKERGDAPVLKDKNTKEFTFDNEPFQLYNAYYFEVVNALGCFPYNIFSDEDKEVKEFISPPEVFIMEKSSSEGIVWFLGEHINHKKIASAFGDKVVIPYKTGVGAVEPKGFVNTQKLIYVTAIAAFILTLIHICTTFSNKQKVLLESNYSFKDSSNTVSFVTTDIYLDKWRSNLEFDIHSPVYNNWFELNATLVNNKTGTEYSLSKGVEYYHGYSDGESWSEGDRYGKAFLNQIPRGIYNLQIQGMRENLSYDFSGNQVKEFNLKVTYDIPNHRNLIVCLLLLVIWPFIQYNIVRYNEKRRWHNSPFSPYSYED